MISFYQTTFKTIPLAEFEAWGEGLEWLNRAKACGAVEEIDDIIREMARFEEDKAVTDMWVNDALWYDENIHEIIKLYERTPDGGKDST